MLAEDYRFKTDAEIVRLSLNNQEYFACLIERYQTKLANYIRKIANLSAEDIEDVLQDVFIKVYKNLNNFNPELKFSSWIYRITHNEVISNYRKLQARPLVINLPAEDDTFLNNLASSLETDNQIDRQLLRKNINQVLDKLDVKYREVLVLKFLEDKDYQEIADILQKPMGTVGTLISRAKIRFKKELAEQNIKF